ncbi:MAG: sialidase family protein [Eubacteriales bacterium]
MKQAKIISHGVVHRNLKSPFRYHGWPSICKLDDGSLAAVWSGFRLAHVCPVRKTAMSISCDEGKTWCSPMIINDTALDDRDAGILNTGNGSLLVTWFCHPKEWMINTAMPKDIKSLPAELASLYAAYTGFYGTLSEDEGKGGSFIRKSIDNGLTWGETIKVPVSSPHGPNLLSDGSLLYLGKELFMNTENIVAYKSTDKGATWSLLSTLQMPEGIPINLFHEPHVAEMPDGSLLGAIRVHGDDYFSVFLTRSLDKGLTWTVPESLIPEGSNVKVCGSPPHLLVHSSGAVICSIGRRNNPNGEHALVSNDCGKTWEEFVLRDDSKSWDLGYPASVELSDGSILTLYYQRFEEDKVTSILYTKWEL